MNHFWKLFACHQTPGGGSGGAGGGGGDGSADELARVKEENARLKEAKDRAVTDARKAAERLKTVDDLEAKVQEADRRAKELEAKLKEAEAAKGNTDATGKPAATAEEVAAMRKELGDLQTFKKSSIEKEAALAKKNVELERDRIITKAIQAAGITGEDETDVMLTRAINDAIPHEDGTWTVKYKNKDGETIEGPIDADYIAARAPKGLFPAKAGGGSGGRPPAGAGGGGKGDESTRDYTQAEWDKMTPEQRKVTQRKRMEGLGVRVR